MSDEPIVQTIDLSHRFGGRVALDRLNLAIPAATIFALLGPNGGGKTTLFRILCTLLLPTEGTAKVAGADVVSQRALVRRRLGIVFQHPSLDKKLTVIENVVHQGYLYGLRGRGLQTRSREALARFDLLDRQNDRAETLSGGLQRRVEIAKSLLHDPRLLILDEPSTGLDPGARADLMDVLRLLRDQHGVASLLTTHLMDEAEKCDRVAILDRGRLVAAGQPAELKASVGGEVITVRTKDADRFALQAREALGVAASVVDSTVYIERDRGHEFVPTLIQAFPGQIESVTVGQPTLDDVFLKLTGHRLSQERGLAD